MSAAEALSPRRYARIAGGFYVVIIVLGIWGEFFVRAALVVAGDPAATGANIAANPALTRFGFTADSIMAMCDVAVAVLLYVLLKPVNAVVALAALAFHLVQTAVLGTNLWNQYEALLIVSGALGAFAVEQQQALALLAHSAHSHNYDIGLLFFGVSGILTGYLVFRSDYLPRVIGVLLVAAGVVYLVGTYLRFWVPEAVGAFEMVYMVPLIAETSFALWLLVRGVDERRWRAASAALAV